MAVVASNSVKEKWQRRNVDLIADCYYPGNMESTTEEYLQWRSKLMTIVKSVIKNELTEKQKYVLEMYYFKNQKLQDIALDMGVTKSEVSRLMKRSRNKIYKLTIYSGILKEKV